MRNVWELFASDMRHLFRNVVSCIITIGLIVMPSIFAWYNLIACWNVFDNTGNITVAVANEDAGYESDLLPVRVNVGDMVVSALRANDQIGWRVTDEADAVDGAASGEYYAAIVIPADFSRDMLRFYTDDSERAQITYYANEKKNAISPKITATGADTVSVEVNTVFAQTLSEVLLGVADSIARYADEADAAGQVAALAGHVEAMAEDVERVSSVIGLYADALRTSQELIDSSAALISSAGDEVRALADKGSTGLGKAQEAAGAIGTARDQMATALDEAVAGFEGFKDALADAGLDELLTVEQKEHLAAMAADAQAKMQAVRDDFNAEVKPNLDRLAADVSSLGADAQNALSRMAQAQGDVSDAAAAAQGILDGAIGQITGSTTELGESAASLRGLAGSITTALAMGDSQALKQVLGADVQVLSTALAAPVAIERIAVFPSEDFGSAMAPFYTALAVFIGSLLILVVVKPTVSNRAQSKLHDLKPRQMLLGRFGCMACISLAQTTLMGVGNLFFLQVQAVHPWLLMLCLWVSGLVFTFIIYVLVLAFANLGKALAVCLLIVQVTGCGGSYPLQILPGFVQQLSPLLPATHAVNAMRAAMFGVYDNDFWMQMGWLLLFLVPAALIGFVLRKPFERFMKWYVRTVESTEIIG